MERYQYEVGCPTCDRVRTITTEGPLTPERQALGVTCLTCYDDSRKGKVKSMTVKELIARLQSLDEESLDLPVWLGVRYGGSKATGLMNSVTTDSDLDGPYLFLYGEEPSE